MTAKEFEDNIMEYLAYSEQNSYYYEDEYVEMINNYKKQQNIEE